jgi:hypothetical protein
MGDGGVLQVLLVGTAALAVVTVALGTRRFQRPVHPQVDIDGLDLPSGLVIFTSTDCATCKEALGVVRRAGVPVREVTWELERRVFERAGIAAVPLVLVVDGEGAVVDQIVGVPRRRRLARAITRLDDGGEG